MILPRGKNTKRMMTARLMYIRRRMASRLQSIVRCLIQMQSLHISQIAVNSDIAYRKGTLTSWTSPSIAMPPFCNSYFHYIRDIQERSTVKTNENITNIKKLISQRRCKKYKSQVCICYGILVTRSWSYRKEARNSRFLCVLPPRGKHLHLLWDRFLQIVHSH